MDEKGGDFFYASSASDSRASLEWQNLFRLELQR